MKKLLLALILVFGTSAHALDCPRPPASLPTPGSPAGTANASMPIEHIVVIMQENHSFDNYFGRLTSFGYKGALDGVTPRMSNPRKLGFPIRIHHAEKLCLDDPDHSWNAMHASWNDGRNDGFAERNGGNVMTYFEASDIPYYYALANEFAISDRYFASVLTQTFPNRMFLFAATSVGNIRNNEPKSDKDFAAKTIFDELDEYGVSWKYYPTKEDYLRLFSVTHARAKETSRIAPIDEFKRDIAQDRLPQVTFLESSEDAGQDEHPASDIQVGQAWVADKLEAVMNSPYWANAVVFLVYDEGGGFFDHVPPPDACAPDDTKAELKPKDLPGDFKRYGFRVPFIAVSPYAKRHFVSHRTYDHTSILKFIETKFNLPALTRRDANADGLLELFDFHHQLLHRGSLPAATIDPAKLSKCPVFKP